MKYFRQTEKCIKYPYTSFTWGFVFFFWHTHMHMHTPWRFYNTSGLRFKITLLGNKYPWSLENCKGLVHPSKNFLYLQQWWNHTQVPLQHMTCVPSGILLSKSYKHVIRHGRWMVWYTLQLLLVVGQPWLCISGSGLQSSWNMSFLQSSEPRKTVSFLLQK